VKLDYDCLTTLLLIHLFITEEALAKVSVIPERLYRGYDFSGSYNRIPDQKRFGNDSFWSFARGSEDKFKSLILTR
jgi:hypothetical protein